MKIAAVQRDAVKGGGWRFTAIMEDGSQVVIRKNATRPYTLAAEHQRRLLSGEWVDADATLHSTTPKARGDWDRIVKIHSVVEQPSPMAEGKGVL
jgi:hypothetical protein